MPRARIIIQIICIGLLSAGSTEAQDLVDLNKRVSKLRLYRDTTVWMTVDSLIALAEKKNDPQAAFEARITKGNLFFTFSRKEEGIQYLSQLYQNWFSQAGTKNKYKLLNGLSLGYMLTEDYPGSLEYASRLHTLAHTHNDSVWIQNAAMKMGQNYLLLGRTGQADNYLMEALDIAFDRQDKIKIIQISNNLLNAHKDELDRQPYIGYLDKYLAFLTRNQIPFDSPHAGLLNILDIDIRKEKLLDLYNNIATFDLVNTRTALVGFIYRELEKLGEVHLAIDLLKQELDAPVNRDSKESLKNIHSYLARSYENTRQFDSAYYHLQKHIAAQMELRGESVQLRTDSLMVLYETARKERQIVQQQLELEKQGKKNQRMVAIGLLILMSILGYIIVSSRKQKFRESLMQKEKAIQAEKLLRLEKENKIMAMDYMLMGEERERQRIAKDLHDSLGSLLSTARRQIAQLNQLPVTPNDNRVSDAEDLVREAAAEVRRISHDMMPEALTNLGLKASIEDLAASLSDSNGPKVSTFFSGIDEQRLTDRQKVGLFRIVQELTQNVLKHAQADEMIIQLSEDEGKLTLLVEDDGRGFDLEAVTSSSSGIGLKNLASRVNYLDGHYEIKTCPGGPTTVEIEIE